MTRVQKQISLPLEYWEAIESNIDNRLVRSRGDALIIILEKVYPQLNINNKEGTKNESVPRPEVERKCKRCKHTVSEHYDNGECALCECKKFTEGAP